MQDYQTQQLDQQLEQFESLIIQLENEDKCVGSNLVKCQNWKSQIHSMIIPSQTLYSRRKRFNTLANRLTKFEKQISAKSALSIIGQLAKELKTIIDAIKQSSRNFHLRLQGDNIVEQINDLESQLEDIQDSKYQKQKKDIHQLIEVFLSLEKDYTSSKSSEYIQEVSELKSSNKSNLYYAQNGIVPTNSIQFTERCSFSSNLEEKPEKSIWSNFFFCCGSDGEKQSDMLPKKYKRQNN